MAGGRKRLVADHGGSAGDYGGKWRRNEMSRKKTEELVMVRLKDGGEGGVEKIGNDSEELGAAYSSDKFYGQLLEDMKRL